MLQQKNARLGLDSRRWPNISPNSSQEVAPWQGTGHWATRDSAGYGFAARWVADLSRDVDQETGSSQKDLPVAVDRPDSDWQAGGTEAMLGHSLRKLLVVADRLAGEQPVPAGSGTGIGSDLDSLNSVKAERSFQSSLRSELRIGWKIGSRWDWGLLDFDYQRRAEERSKGLWGSCDCQLAAGCDHHTESES